MIYSNRTLFISIAIFLLVLIFSQCISKDEKINITNAKGEKYIGSEACKSCHRTIYDSFVHTAHYHDSRPASKETVKGSFDRNKNYFLFGFGADQVVVMEDKGDGLFQVAYVDRKEREAHRFDIVIGSARKGQSFLYWKGDHLFQLPISYFTPTDSWVNSPGYPVNNIVFSRVINGRCLECHSTYAKQIVPQAGPMDQSVSFARDQIIYGIDCERCHGPAATHVAFHEQHPQEKKGKYIVNPASLSRQQRLDACALCHSGAMKSVQPAFSFLPGDTLSNYFQPNHTVANNAGLDVHGNQYGLLTASKCFIVSKTMDCSSCHNTHVEERSNLSLFSQRCMNCHKEEYHNFCKMGASLGVIIKENCIDCHMPTQPSKVLSVQSSMSGSNTAALVRSHFITVYPKETQKFLALMKK